MEYLQFHRIFALGCRLFAELLLRSMARSFAQGRGQDTEGFIAPKLTWGIQPPVLTFSETGFAVIPDFIEAMELDHISRCIDAVVVDGVGTRGLIATPWCAALANRVARDDRLRQVMPVDAVPVQCTLFVKSTRKNWLLWLHQDLSIPVAQRVPDSHYTAPTSISGSAGTRTRAQTSQLKMA